MLYLLAFQVEMPKSGDDPFAWISFVLVLGLGALFLRYDGRPARADVERQQERDKERETKLIDDNRSNMAVMKEQSTTLIRAVNIAEDGVALSRQISETVAANQKEVLAKLEENRRMMDDVIRKFSST